jgi:hypothetical protein
VGLVQSKQGAATASPLSITLDNPTTAGNGLVVMVTSCGTTANGSVSGVTLGGAAGNFASAASVGASGDESIAAAWLDLNCAGGQTAVSIAFTGGSGTQQFFAAVYERDDLLASAAFDKSAGNISTFAWTSGATATTSQPSEVLVGMVFITGSSPPVITGPAAPWANLAQQSATQATFLDAWMSGWQAVSSPQAATYSGTVTNGTNGTALVITLKATTSVPAAPAARLAPGWHPGRGLPGLPGGTPFSTPLSQAPPAATITAGESRFTGLLALASATGVSAPAGTANLNATGSLDTTAVTQQAPATLGGAGSLAASAVQVTPATLGGQGSLATAATQQAPSALSGAGSIGTAAVQGGGTTLGGAGSAVTAATQLAPATLGGAGSLTAQGNIAGAATLGRGPWPPPRHRRPRLP